MTNFKIGDYVIFIKTNSIYLVYEETIFFKDYSAISLRFINNNEHSFRLASKVEILLFKDDD